MTTSAEFVHLHVHSEYSLLDGAIRIPNLIARTAELGMPAVALTDHGAMFAALQFYQACMSAGIAPIIGCEVNLSSRPLLQDQSDVDTHHLVVLAATQEGYRNLVHLVSRGWVEGLSRHGEPRVDLEMVRAHSKGLVGLSGCMGGYPAQTILMQGQAAGKKVLRELSECFEKDHFYVELQDHGFPENRALNGIFCELAKQLDLPLVASNDCHYLEQHSARAQMALQCVGGGHSMQEMETMHHHSSEMYFKSPAQMRQLFHHMPEAIKNTLRIAEMCRGQANPISTPLLPRFPVPEGYDETSFLRELARAGLQVRLQDRSGTNLRFSDDDYRSRLEHEIDVIINMGFAGYFLIVQDFINWAKKNDIPVGPGRGSGAGSVVAWALRITELDPLVHGLLFERFLNPERVSMPDFDIDFCMDKRDQVIRYVQNKFGAQSVGQIATFHQLKSRSVVRDVGRVMGMTPAEAGRIATLIPEPVLGKTVSIEEALQQEPRLKGLVQNDAKAAEVVATAQELENLTRHAGMHAAGVVISEGPIWNHVPVFCPEPHIYVTQFHKDDVETAGLVKFDFLGLRTLTVIDLTVKLVNRRPDREGNPLDIQKIPMDDPAVFALLQTGETTNVFQLESSGMQSLFKQLRPDHFGDIVAAVALYRPGPMGAGMDKDFVHRKHGRAKIEYPDPRLQEILEETRGVIVYQEQVMQIAQKMAGYTLGEADLLRRAMGKKKASEMKEQKDIFVRGAIKNNYTRQKAEEVFELMAYFAGYGFNKSHSAAYALITYQTAFLKAHYPVEFACATLSADKDKIDKVVRTISEARAMGITVLPPDVNESDVDFTVVYSPETAADVTRLAHKPVCHDGRVHDPMNPVIRFGLGAVKGVGIAALQAILEARQSESDPRPFDDLFDLCARVDLRRINKSVLEALVQCGALDAAHSSRQIHRAQAFASIESAIERAKRAASELSTGQTNLFGLIADNEAERRALQLSQSVFQAAVAWDAAETLRREKNILGFYVSGHPLDRYRQELGRFCNSNTETLSALSSFDKVTLGGVVEGYRERRTKMGYTMAFFHLEDAQGRVEVIVRPKLLEAEDTREILTSSEPILLKGHVKHEEGQESNLEAKVILESVSLFSTALSERARGVRIRLEVEELESTRLADLRNALLLHPGPCPVTIELCNPAKSWNVSLNETGVYVNPTNALFSSLEQMFGKSVCELQ